MLLIVIVILLVFLHGSIAVNLQQQIEIDKHASVESIYRFPYQSWSTPVYRLAQVFINHCIIMFVFLAKTEMTPWLHKYFFLKFSSTSTYHVTLFSFKPHPPAVTMHCLQELASHAIHCLVIGRSLQVDPHNSMWLRHKTSHEVPRAHRMILIRT